MVERSSTSRRHFLAAFRGPSSCAIALRPGCLHDSAIVSSESPGSQGGIEDTSGPYPLVSTPPRGSNLRRAAVQVDSHRRQTRRPSGRSGMQRLRGTAAGRINGIDQEVDNPQGEEEGDERAGDCNQDLEAGHTSRRLFFM